METKFKLLVGAQADSNTFKRIIESFNRLASSHDTTGVKLMEGATQMLAGLRSLVSRGKPLTNLGLSAASIAGVVAGLDVLVNKLPSFDSSKKQQAISLLSNVNLGSNMSLGAVQSIADLAEQNPNRKMIQQLFAQYEEQNTPSDELTRLLGTLQMSVDKAISRASVDM